MDSRKLKSDDVKNVIKTFENKIGRKVYAVYDGGDSWLINSKPNDTAFKFSVDPFYKMAKDTKSIDHFNPFSTSAKERIWYNKALKNTVFKIEISKEDEQRLFNEYMKELYKDS